MSDDSNDRAHARIGEVLNDKWTLEQLIGVGGMGAVYAGVHRNGTKAAVKVMHRYLAKHEEVRTRFLREGYAANRVDHPSAVKVTDDDIVKGGPDDGTAYLVMELLVGESLERRTQRGIKVTEREFLAVAEVVLEVLEAAHAANVVHRDIKPDNIFIAKDADGATHIKVLDFGLAKVLEGQSTTQYGVALGTPSFMSPEQAAGRNDEIDGRTDLFALAATGFRLITGKRIHEGANSVELVVKMGQLPAPRIRTVQHDVSDAFADVIDRALEFRRENRYENAAAMRAEVKKAIVALDIGLHATSPAMPIPPVSAIELSASNLEPAEATPPPPTRQVPSRSNETTLPLPVSVSKLVPPTVAPATEVPATAAPATEAAPSTMPSGTEPTQGASAPPSVPVKTVVLAAVPVRTVVLPAIAAPLPPTEASLAPIPMGRSYVVPVLVVVALLAVFLGVGALAGWFSSAAPEGATEPSESSDGAAAEADAAVDAKVGADASPVANAVDAPAPPRQKALPTHRGARPWKPVIRTKH